MSYLEARMPFAETDLCHSDTVAVLPNLPLCLDLVSREKSEDLLNFCKFLKNFFSYNFFPFTSPSSPRFISSYFFFFSSTLRIFFL